MDHTALPMDWPLPVPPASFPSLFDSHSVLHSCQNPKFFHTSVPLLMLFLSPRLPFPSFFAKIPLTHYLRLHRYHFLQEWHLVSNPTPGGPCLHLGTPSIRALLPHAEIDLVPSLSPLLCARWCHHLLINALVSSVTHCNERISGGCCQAVIGASGSSNKLN